MTTPMPQRNKNKADSGFTTFSLITYIAVGGIIIVAIAALLIIMTMQQRSAADERSQTAAVEQNLRDIVRAVDESATIFHATETELGIARNITATAGGIDCQLDQYWAHDTGDGWELRRWETEEVGACRDRPTWVAPASIPAGEVAATVSNLEPFTLVNDEGLVSAACTATATESERGGGAGYCVPLFRYLDSTGNEFVPNPSPPKNTISAVKIVLTASVDGNQVPVSRSKTVSPNNYTSNTQVGEVAEPMCPANLTRSVAGTNVTLNWAPVPNATQYRVVRTYNGTTTTRATLTVASMPSAANPSYTDSIAGMSATSIVYQVVPMVAGNEVSGCPQTVLSIQVGAPSVSVTINGASGSEWQGRRTSNSAFTNFPEIAASWSAVAGASGYEAEMREMNPNGAAAPLTGWAALSWNGANTPSNYVSGTSVATDEFNGSRLFSRAFQIRVRAVSDSGSSPWTYCFMKPGDGNNGSCRTFPGNSFPQNTSTNGFLVMPAPGLIEADDVDRNGVVALSWGTSGPWSAAQYNRETNDFYRVQRHQRNGTTTTVSYTASDYSNIVANTTATSGTSQVNDGDWSHFRVLRCNYRNPFETSGGTQQCGPSSRVWSTLGVPSVPNVSATVNSSANSNTVRWGKHSATTWADFDNQRVTQYDVAEQQGGGSGTSQASGNKSSADDTVNGTAKSSPWLNNTTDTWDTHPRRQGDFTRYSAVACNRTITDSSYVAGVTGEAGQGTNVLSCSNWSADTQRYWQALTVPQCTATDTWNEISITAHYSNMFVSALDTVLDRQITRYNTTEGRDWSRGASNNSSADMTRSWVDDEVSSDASENTVKPNTGYRAGASITTVYAAPTGSANTNCDTGTVDAPPVPGAPSVWVGESRASTTTANPIVTVRWSDDDSPVTTNYLIGSVNNGTWTATAQNGAYAQQGRWNQTVNYRARGAHTPRLASWGYYSPIGSDSFTPSHGSGGIPCPIPTLDWVSPTGGYTTWGYGNLVQNSSYCEYDLQLGSYSNQVRLAYYRNVVATNCSNPVPQLYCNPASAQETQATIWANANTPGYAEQGDYVNTYRFTFGVDQPGANAYQRQSNSQTVVNLPSPFAMSSTIVVGPADLPGTWPGGGYNTWTGSMSAGGYLVPNYANYGGTWTWAVVS